MLSNDRVASTYTCGLKAEYSTDVQQTKLVACDTDQNQQMYRTYHPYKPFLGTAHTYISFEIRTMLREAITERIKQP